MATRILLADVPDFIKNTLLNIRKGLEDANSAGLHVELPLEVPFDLEIISSAQSLLQVTNTEDDRNVTNPTETTTEAAATTTTTEAAATTTTTEAAATTTTTEAAAVDVEVTERAATQASTDGGADIDVTDYNYDSFEEA